MEAFTSRQFISQWTVTLYQQPPPPSSSPKQVNSRAMTWTGASRAMTWTGDSRAMTWEGDSRRGIGERNQKLLARERRLAQKNGSHGCSPSTSASSSLQAEKTGSYGHSSSTSASSLPRAGKAGSYVGFPSRSASSLPKAGKTGSYVRFPATSASSLPKAGKTGSYGCFPSRSASYLPKAGKTSPLAVSEGGGTEEETSLEPVRRLEVLKELDKLLEAKEDREAVALLRSLKGREGGIRAFGAATQVPQRPYTIEDLRLNKIEPALLLSPQDKTLGAVRRNALLAAVLGFGSAAFFLQLDQSQILAAAVALLFVGTADQIGNGGGGESLVIDTFGRLFSQRYRQRVAQHEAGHFLVSYLLGTLPRGYTLSSADALLRYGAQNVQAGTQFVDYDFQEEVEAGTLSSKMLDRVSCIALAGVAVEYLQFGSAEGGLSDILQLDGVMRSIGFTQKKADFQVRWAVLNTISLLRRHKKVLLALAACMSASKSVGECIDLIETELEGVEDL